MLLIHRVELKLLAVGRLGFMLAPVVILLYVAYRLVAPRLERKLEEHSRRREMRKRIRAMLKINLRYLP